MTTDRRIGPLVNGLTAAIALQWVGAGAVLPTLPVFLTERGAPPALIGIAMAAFFLAGVITQYPIGHLVDRSSERPILLGGLAIYAVASQIYLAPFSPWLAVGVRFAQGMGAGAVQIASLALVGRRVPVDRRGAGFARISAGQLGGLAIGPLFGVVAGTAHLESLFVISAAASTAAGLAIVRVVPKRGENGDGLWRQQRPSAGLLLMQGRRFLLLGLLGVALIAGLTVGVYETCWTLLLRVRDAPGWAIGVSWTLFCVPYVVMTPFAGRLADRFHRPRLITISLVGTVVLAMVYPFISSIQVILALGVLEAAGTAVAFPAAQAMLADGVPAELLGRAQGLFATTETAATAVAAIAGGALFGVGPAVPFVAVGVLSMAVLLSLPPIWSASSRHSSSEIDVRRGVSAR